MFQKMVLLLFCLFFMSLGARLPEGPLIIGYANWAQCDDKIAQDVRDGLNVVIWFSVDLLADPATGKPAVLRGPDYDCVANMVKKIRDEGYDVVHLMAIGGWNSAHPDTRFSAQEWWATMKAWNKAISKPQLGFNGFDGFDWDIEGNDDMNNPNNHFTAAALDLMGGISQLGKADGYIMTMAPSQSYLDCENNAFDRSLLHAPVWKPDFFYHGRNVYAAILAKYGSTKVPGGEVPTFDFISLQLYEGWSRANFEITRGASVTNYLNTLIQEMSKGWIINFASDPEMKIPTQVMKVPSTQLVIGLANAWAGPNLGDKFLLVWPEQINYKELTLKPRGWMFWNIQDEGEKGLVLAAELKKMICGSN